MSPPRPLRSGIYAPIPSFFFPENEDLDILTFETHVRRLAEAGVYPVISGTMGEAIHLSHSERVALIKAARRTLDNAGRKDFPIVAGTGTGSTRETIELCQEAAGAGADYAIVITSGYFAPALTQSALEAFFKEVGDKSPIPVLVYNYPRASGGIDLQSDVILELAQNCPNIVGVKLTCGDVGKLTRIAMTISDPAFTAKFPRVEPQISFHVLGGYSDFLVPSTFVNGHGAITGLANLAPYTHVKLHQLAEASRNDLSLLPDAQQLQGIVARADLTVRKTSISGTKWLLEKIHGYGGLPRKPLPPIDPMVAQALWEHPDTQELIKVERELEARRQ